MTPQRGKLGDRALARRRKILNAARDMLISRGYQGATVELIAKKAGYSKRTVYLDFKNKDDLLVSVVAEGMDALVGGLAAAKEKALPGDPFPWVDALMAFNRKDPDYLKLFLTHVNAKVMAGASDTARGDLEKLQVKGLGLIAGMLPQKGEPLGPPREMAWEEKIHWARDILMVMLGAYLMRLSGSRAAMGNEDVETSARRMTEVFWAGLCSRLEKGAERLTIG